MSEPQRKPLRIVQRQASAKASKQQKAFNQSIERIARLRESIAAWDAAIPRIRQSYVRNVTPLHARIDELRRALLSALVKAYGNPGTTRAERKTVSTLIVALAGGLLAEVDDPELKAIYNEHAAMDFDQEQALALEEAKRSLEEALDVEIGPDVDLRSPDAVLQHLEELWQEGASGAETQQRTRKKSARQIEREARRKADEARVNQSLRDIYRKLASALHPDREPDPAERERKTVLMQRANQAYEANNLLQLLELQIELEHIDQQDLDRLTDEQLARYNVLLKSQVQELEAELQSTEDSVRMQFELSPYDPISPQFMMRHLTVVAAELRDRIRSMEQDLAAIGSVATLRPWLKSARRQLRSMSRDSFSLDE